MNHLSTSITTRVWVTEEILAARKMIIANPGLLTPALQELAKLAKTEDGGYPRWLVHGLAARHFREWLESRLTPIDAAYEQSMTEFAAGVPAAKPKRGTR